MKIVAALYAGVLGLTIPATVPAQPAANPPLRLVQSIPLPGVQGRIDHMAADLKGRRLFVAALGNNTVEVVDLNAGKVLKSLKGFHEPQGVAYLPDFDRIVVANGQGGGAVFLDGKTYNVTHRIEPLDDADNVRYDPVAKKVWVGYGSGALAEIDAASGERLADIKLPGHPESFQLERNGRRIFVNVPSASQVVIVDRHAGHVTGHLEVAAASANFPMALHEAGQLLFVGCRKPARVIVYDTHAAKLILGLECVGDTDDLFWDSTNKHLYVTGGQGAINVISVAGDDRVLGRLMAERTADVTTAPGARTSFWVPELHRLYVACRKNGARSAEIRVFEAGK